MTRLSNTSDWQYMERDLTAHQKKRREELSAEATEAKTFLMGYRFLKPLFEGVKKGVRLNARHLNPIEEAFKKEFANPDKNGEKMPPKLYIYLESGKLRLSIPYKAYGESDSSTGYNSPVKGMELTAENALTFINFRIALYEKVEKECVDLLEVIEDLEKVEWEKVAAMKALPPAPVFKTRIRYTDAQKDIERLFEVNDYPVNRKDS